MFSDVLARLRRQVIESERGTPKDTVRVSRRDLDALLVHFDLLDDQVRAGNTDARRWQAVRDGSYELLHNLTTAPAQYREQIIDEVSK